MSLTQQIAVLQVGYILSYAGRVLSSCAFIAYFCIIFVLAHHAVPQCSRWCYISGCTADHRRSQNSVILAQFRMQAALRCGLISLCMPILNDL